MKEDKSEEKLLKMLRTVAPGTLLREGLDNILKANTGGLIILGDGQEIMDISEGGFAVNADFSPASLYELAKMDGAIILSSDAKRILAANTQLIPNLSIPSTETGIRHRTAERVARQTSAMVISISQRRNVVTIYKGNLKYVLRDLGVILTKANQAVQTLEKYRIVLDKVVNELGILEFEDSVTLIDVARYIQRADMVLRVVGEIEKYVSELGTEGRLITLQMEELVSNVEPEGLLIIQDYAAAVGDKTPVQIMDIINSWPAEDLLDFSLIIRTLGYPGNVGALDQIVSPRGYRILSKIPRLPLPVIENLVREFGVLKNILNATIQELDEVEGIGEARARSIKEGLSRYRKQLFQERHF
ncbi:MAG: DNA integrity scanning protein disA [Desulfotomaculum sp. 46_296]|nr:MAG: DNA integrity scanning protein disA [Desulfotomaculum sp. 46_296]HAU31405.1 DNA integrity scanning protein DisA [Desulfotomaculum sp.]